MGLLLTVVTTTVAPGAAHALPFDCEKNQGGAATLDLIRIVRWVESKGTWWGTGSDGVTEISNVPPWLRPRFKVGQSNPDGSYTTYEYLSNYECP
jgi:hypothetical protein